MKSKSIFIIVFLLTLAFKNASGYSNSSAINPDININNSVSSLRSCVGNSSVVKSFSVHASNINTAVNIHASTHLEVSLDQNNFVSCNIALYPVSNAVENTVIFFRQKSNNQIGVYADTVFISTADQMPSFIILTDTVLATPVAHFNIPSVCFGAYAQFKDSSYIADGTLNGWYWNFGDGMNSSFNNPSHFYNAAGNYAVKLSVTSAMGCTKDSSAIVSVFPTPRAKIAVSNSGCANSPVLFFDSTDLHGAVLKTWKWIMLDSELNSILTTQNAKYTYTKGGVYTISLRVSTDKGCTDSTAIGILINAPVVSPVVTSLISLCQGANVNPIQVNVSKGYRLLWYQQSNGGAGVENVPVPSTATIGSTDFYVSQQNNATGCLSDRLKITVKVNAVPDKPVISQNTNSELLSSADMGNQWFNKVSAISSEINPIFKPTSDGIYYVQVTQNGCVSLKSEPYQFINNVINNRSSNDLVTVFPNPVYNDFKVNYQFSNSGTVIAELYNFNQILISQKIITSGCSMNISGNNSGTYVLRLLDSKTRKLLYTCNIIKIK